MEQAPRERPSHPILSLAVAIAAAFAFGAYVVAVSSRDEGLDSPPAAASSDGRRSARPTSVVDTFEYAFSPRIVRIRVGEAVAWRGMGEQAHLVTPSHRPGERMIFFRAGDHTAKRHVFRRPGTYGYFCAFHPQMTGKVIVAR